jgi:hypothetical protein
MPTKGWKGLTKDDNFQALAIAKVMKQFTDEGIDVQLRFAHEVNWYQTDGTYQGTAKDFKEGWATVAAAVADNPKVKMFVSYRSLSSRTFSGIKLNRNDSLSIVHTKHCWIARRLRSIHAR